MQREMITAQHLEKKKKTAHQMQLTETVKASNTAGETEGTGM